MEVIFAIILAFFAMCAACVIVAFVFGACCAAVINALYYAPRLLLIGGRQLCVALQLMRPLLISTIRERTREAARGVAIFEGVPQWQSEARARAKAEAAIPEIDSWEAACTLLSLPVEGFGKTELSRAYRAAIVTAHPDLGGNPKLAQAVNVARDLIRDQQGWK